ncbi:MAG: FAD-dependent monooxygenase, partial [Pseudomonadota bacterium]
MPQHVTIVGGGLVGASLACALEPLDIDITVLEATLFDDEAQSSFDERTIALTFSSRRVLDGIGIWPQIAAQAGPIHRIHISNRG